MLLPVIFLISFKWEWVVGLSAGLATLFVLWGQIKSIAVGTYQRAVRLKQILDAPDRLKDLEDYRTKVTTSLELLTDKTDRLAAAISSLTEQVSGIASEFKPNGGSSLRDAVNGLTLQQYVSNESRRKLMESGGLAFWESDRDGSAIYLSEPLLDIIGLDSRDALGYGWASCLHNEDKARVIAEWDLAVKTHRKFIQTYRFTTPQGVTTKIQANSTPIIKSNVIVGFIGVITKIDAISTPTQ